MFVLCVPGLVSLAMARRTRSSSSGLETSEFTMVGWGLSSVWTVFFFLQSLPFFNRLKVVLRVGGYGQE